MIRFVVLGHPATQGSKVAGVRKDGRRFVRDSNKSLPGWRQLVATVAQQYAPAEPYQGAISLELDFFLPVPKSAPKRRRLAAIRRPDSIKMARAVEDALTGIFWRDDSQIVRHVITKHLAYSAPVGCHIWIEELPASEEIPKEARA